MTRLGKVILAVMMLLLPACNQQSPTIDVKPLEPQSGTPLTATGGDACVETEWLESPEYDGGPVLLYCTYTGPSQVIPTDNFEFLPSSVD